MKKIYLLFLACVFLSIQPLFARQKTIAGKVTDAASGSPLPGVTVREEGTTNGTLTDGEGNYRLTLLTEGAALQFSIVGYETATVHPRQGTVNVSLKPGSQSLNEIVVVGYGTRERRDLTGSISKITAAEVADLPLPSFESALQGRAPGVFINSGSGKLGQSMDIRIRGISSITASNRPLIVIDGLPVVSGSLNTVDEPDDPLSALNPDDIASIEVLKDASAAAIYGSRASNGVIIITTKSGKAGKTHVNLGFYTGISNPARKREFLDADEYRQLFTEAFKNSSLNGIYWEKDNPSDAWYQFTGTHDWDSSYNTNWADKAFRQGYVTQYSADISGGDAKTQFLLGGTYNDQQGIISGNRLSRVTGRINLEHTASSLLKVGLNTTLFKSVNHRVPDDNDFSNPLQLNALAPVQPEIDPQTGDYYRQTIYYNNIIDRKYSSDVATIYRAIGSLYASLDLAAFLNFRSEFGFDILDMEESQWNGKNTQNGATYNGYAYDNYVRSVNFNLNNYFTFHRSFAEAHDLKIVGGMSFYDSKTKSASATGGGFPNDKFTKISNAATILAGTSTETAYDILSYFTRASYKFRERYLLEASLRVDGSSRFSPEYRYGVFPAVSAGWIVSEERFLEDSRVLSFLKPRISYGKTGNAEIGNFSYRSLWSTAFAGDQAGIVPTQIGYDSLHWESTLQLDAGIDFGLFGNRITGTVDYFNKQTHDLLLNFAVPAQNGFTSILKNIGSLENKGWELSLNTENLTGAFRWSSRLNLSGYKNKVKDLGGISIPQSDATLGRVAEGEPFGYFYGYKYAGVNPDNGDALYYNAKGEKVSFNEFDGYKQKVGDPNPMFFGGFGNTFSYHGFDLDIQTQFVYGYDLFNIAGVYQLVEGNFFDNQTRDQLNYWKQKGDQTGVPQPRFLDDNGTVLSSRWVENASYLRIKNVMLGYNLPAGLVRRWHMDHIRVYMAAQNLWTFTGYSGYDPEVNSLGEHYLHLRPGSGLLYAAAGENDHPRYKSRFLTL